MFPTFCFIEEMKTGTFGPLGLMVCLEEEGYSKYAENNTLTIVTHGGDACSRVRIRSAKRTSHKKTSFTAET